MDAFTILQIGVGIIFLYLVFDSLKPVKNLQQLTEANLNEQIKKSKNVVLIDVRNPYEYQTNHIKGAVNIPLSKIKRKKELVPTDKKIILYCQTGIRSKQAAKVLRRRHKDLPIAHLQGGLYSLKNDSHSKGRNGLK